MKKNLISPVVLILIVVVAAYLVIGQNPYPPLTGPVSVVDALGRTVQVELPV
ncbi:MAG: hypothetical protein H5T49_03370, partial [Hadesarchaea archaeon]|nr:hypothetical protein [Hadesarchaea archaeon]